MSIKDTLRKIRLSLGKQLIDIKKRKTEVPTEIKRILFLRQDGKIGDYIVSSFVFREIKKQMPAVHIGVVCTKNNAYLFTDNPYIDQLYFVKKRSIFSLIKCGLNLRKFQYDVVIDPTVLLRNRDLLFLRLINAKINLGYLKDDYKLFNLNIDNPNLHFADVYKTALEKIGFHSLNTEYEIPSNESAKNAVEKFIKKNQLTKFIAINFFGNGSSRRFNDSNIVAILDHSVKNTELPIVLLTYPEMTEKLKTLSMVNGQWSIPYRKIFIMEETTTIFHTIELIRRCNLLISPDTATIHIAAGLNKPIIGFYSQDQENFVHWHPNSKNKTFILRYGDNINEIKPEQIPLEQLK
ncbi:glycosyltransferase family 9 protein [Caviibacterium pharyngocola]|uniref:Heptosyltransferase n=1 Tax=Caviibacterium pharyngocola TaxID=28159 RepID=A0A2M8RYD5_9PAST|nr:glycosyltransferase family 9 protein [Caviibacterium pharyngocola]PJG83901.1 heptosyltransferase [Caviibacterium pharyngocola]